MASQRGAGFGGIPRDSLLLGVTTFAFISATNIITPLLPQVRDDFGVSIATAGLIVGSYGLARLIIDLPAGFLADRIGHRRISIIAVILLAASSILGWAAPSVEVLMASRVVSGLAAGTLGTVQVAALAATATGPARGRIMSVFGLANNAGVALYPILGGVVGSIWGWRPTFIITAIFAVIAGVILLGILSRLELGHASGSRKAGETDPALVLEGSVKTRAQLSISFGVVAMMIHRAGVRNTVLPLYAATVLGLNEVNIATGLALGALSGLVVATPGGMAGDRWGRRRVIVTGLLVIAAGDLAFILTHDLLTFLVVAGLIGLGDFFTASQTALLTEIVPAAERTRTLSAYRFSSDLGAMIGPIILAAAMDAADTRASLLLAVAILVTAAALTYTFVPSRIDALRIRRAKANASGAAKPAAGA